MIFLLNGKHDLLFHFNCKNYVRKKLIYYFIGHQCPDYCDTEGTGLPGKIAHKIHVRFPITCDLAIALKE